MTQFNWLGLFILSLIITSMGACQHTDSEVQAAHEQVMEIHDEVMPKQSDISAAQLRIKQWIKKQDETFTIPDEISVALAQLTDAEEAMWSWMNNYSKPKSDEELSSALQYLKAQEESISTVREQMLTSLEAYEVIKQKYNL